MKKSVLSFLIVLSLFLAIPDFAAADTSEIEKLKQAVRENPKNAMTHTLLGILYVDLKRYEEAIVELKKAVSINPDYHEVHYGLGLVYGELKRYGEAIVAYQEAIHINPGYAEAHYELGMAYFNLGRFNEAFVELKKAININPDYAEAHAMLGITYFSRQRYDEAILELKEALRIQPNHFRAQFLLNLMSTKGMGHAPDDSRDIEKYKQAVRKNPKDAVAHFELAVAYNKLSRYGEAIAEIKKALHINPEYAKAQFALGLMYDEGQGVPQDSKQAVKWYRQAAEQGDVNAELILFGMSRDIEKYKQAVRKNPKDAVAHFNLGGAYWKQGLYEEAIVELKKTIHINPDYAAAYFGLGMLYNASEDGINAILFMETAKKLYDRRGNIKRRAQVRKKLRGYYTAYDYTSEDFPD